jgi:hypothetical protein
LTRAFERSDSATALAAIWLELLIWRLISDTELVSSSAAVATVCTFVEACSDAAATATA